MNSAVYFEAFYDDDSEILGNLDGQYVHRGPRYDMTSHYKALKTGLNRPLWRRVNHWKVTVNGRVIEVIKNPHARE